MSLDRLAGEYYLGKQSLLAVGIRKEHVHPMYEWNAQSSVLNLAVRVVTPRLSLVKEWRPDWILGLTNSFVIYLTNAIIRQ